MLASGIVDALREFREDRVRILVPAQHLVQLGKPAHRRAELWMARREDLLRPGQQIFRRRDVEPPIGAKPGTGKSLPRALGEVAGGVVDQADSPALVAGLFQVIADEFLEFERAVCCFPLQPPGEPLMQRRAVRARHAPVRGELDQGVPELECWPVEDWSWDRPDELLLFQHPEISADVASGRRRHQRGEGVGGKLRARNRGASQQIAFGGAELVEPRGEQRLHRGRDRQLPDVPPCGEHLLQVQRVAAAEVEQPRHRSRGRLRRGVPIGDQLFAVAPAEGTEKDRRRVVGGPCRTGVEEFGPRQAQQQHRPPDGSGQVLQQIEQRGLGPVHVFEDDHQRLVGGNGFQEQADCGKQLGGA